MELKNHKYRFWVSIFISLTISFILAAVFDQITLTNVWNGTKPINVTCEPVNRTNFLAQRYNALTTLAFDPSFLIPLCFFAADVKSKIKPTRLSKYPFLSFLTFFNYLAHFVGTFVNHACGCELGLVLDNLFLWTSLSVPIIITFTVYIPKLAGVPRLKYYSTVLSLYFANALVATILALAKLVLLAQTIITAVMLAAVIIPNLVFVIRSFCLKTNRYTIFFWFALAAGIIGLIFAALDGVLCNSVFGTHAVWHILGGLGLTLLYIHHWCL